jgi:hypothetical protein
VQCNKVRTGLWWDNLLAFSHFFKLRAVVLRRLAVDLKAHGSHACVTSRRQLEKNC